MFGCLGWNLLGLPSQLCVCVIQAADASVACQLFCSQTPRLPAAFHFPLFFFTAYSFVCAQQFIFLSSTLLSLFQLGWEQLHQQWSQWRWRRWLWKPQLRRVQRQLLAQLPPEHTAGFQTQLFCYGELKKTVPKSPWQLYGSFTPFFFFFFFVNDWLRLLPRPSLDGFAVCYSAMLATKSDHRPQLYLLIETKEVHR